MSRFMSKPISYHIVPATAGEWKLIRSGSVRAVGRFKSQQLAIQRARELAQDTGSIYKHKQDGRVEDIICGHSLVSR